MLTLLKNNAIWLALFAASVLVFFAYTQPDFIVNVANQVWLCF